MRKTVNDYIRQITIADSIEKVSEIVNSLDDDYISERVLVSSSDWKKFNASIDLRLNELKIEEKPIQSLPSFRPGV